MEKEFILNSVENELITRSLIDTLHRMEDDMYFYRYNEQLYSSLDEESDILCGIIEKFLNMESDLKCVAKE